MLSTAARIKCCKFFKTVLQRVMQQQFHEATMLVKENDARKESADANIEMEKRKLNNIERELEQLQARRDCAVRETRKIEDDRNRLSSYVKFLERVVTESEQEFMEVPDILKRFSALRIVKKDLLVQYKEEDEVLERNRVEIQQYQKRKQNEILVQNSLFSEKQRKLEEVRGELQVVQDKYEQERERVKSINCEVT